MCIAIIMEKDIITETDIAGKTGTALQETGADANRPCLLFVTLFG